MSRTTTTRLRRGLAIAVGAACLALPAAASADSIVYIAGGNVWSAAPDGSRAVQLTDGGDWHSPTQSDDGTIAAVEGTGRGITVLSRDGRPLRTITTPMAKSGNGDTFAPNPVQLSFSPDGSKIAYSYVQFSCVPGSTCGTAPQLGTLITDASGDTPAAKYGYQQGVSAPEWLTGSRLIVWGRFLTGGALVDIPSADGVKTPWIEPDGEDVGDGEVSRDGTRIVFTRFYGDNLLLRFAVTNGDPRSGAPAAITPSCDSDKDPSVSDPSWSPDGRAVAFAESRGINVFRFNSMGPNTCDLASSTIVLPGASEPDWGPADPPAARAAAAGPATGTPAPAGTPAGPGTGPGTGSGKGARRTVRVRSVVLRRTVLLRGTGRVRVTVPGAGRLRVTVRAGRKAVTTGRAKARKAGTVIVKLRAPSRKGRRALRGHRRLRVSATLRRANGKRVSSTGTLRVR